MTQAYEETEVGSDKFGYFEQTEQGRKKSTWVHDCNILQQARFEGVMKRIVKRQTR